MSHYTVPLREIQFVLHELLKVEDLPIPAYDQLTPDLTEAVITGAGRIATDFLAPVNASGDLEGCILDNGVVRTPKGHKEAYRAMVEGGWTSLDLSPEHGGAGLPFLLQSVVNEIFVSANMALHMYPGLSHGAYSAIFQHGNEAQKALYLPKLASGDWTGTMALTEAHAGSDLGLMRSSAKRCADGSFRISGTKIFISSGEHDLTENIVHLVLARIEGAPQGTKGISLFIVPKVLPHADGSLGARNGVLATRLERKVGIHANSTCELQFEEATGFLLGEEGRGMKAMFTMMNEARLGVAVQAYALAEGALQKSYAYAQERLQGRTIPAPAAPEKAADPIIAHADIRRMLLRQRAFIEGGRALALRLAQLIDESRRTGSPLAEERASLLTPVVKGFLTDKGFESAIQGMQIFGGHGYIEDSGIAQFSRDARITMIYEGTNGIQALDLVARKIAADKGAGLMRYMGDIHRLIAELADFPALENDFRLPLRAALKDAESAVHELASKPAEVGVACAYEVLHLIGYLSLGLMWARSARIAQTALDGDTSERSYYEGKLATGRYFMQWELPATAMHLHRIRAASALLDARF